MATWCVKDPAFAEAPNAKRWKSRLFSAGGLRWQMQACPNGRTEADKGYTVFMLYWLARPPNIKKITIDWTVTNQETNTSCDIICDLSEDTHTSWQWPDFTLKYSEVKKHKQWTFTITISVIAVYDKSDTDVTARYTQNASDPAVEEAKESDASPKKKDEALPQSIKASLDSIIEQLDKLNSKVEKLEQLVKVVDVNVSKWKPNSQRHPDEQELKKWLEYDVGLPQYFDMFLENHINDLSTAKLLNLQMLQGMGIALGHRVVIFDHIKKLNQNKK